MKIILLILLLFANPICARCMALTRPINSTRTAVVDTISKRHDKSPYQDGIHHIIAGFASVMLGVGAIAWHVLGTMPAMLEMFTSFLGAPLVCVGLILILVGAIKCGIVYGQIKKKRTQAPNTYKRK